MKKFDQVGTWLNGEEIFYLNRIIEHKRLAKGLKEIVVPVLRILLKYGVRIDYVSGGWSTDISLSKGERLPEKAYREIAALFKDYPEIVAGEFDGIGHFTFTVAGYGAPIRYINIKLAKGTCVVREVKKIITEPREVTRYEMVGDCSGLV